MNFGHSIYWFVWIATFLPEPKSVSLQEDLLILLCTHVGTGSAVGTWWWTPTEFRGMSAFPPQVLSTQTPDWTHLLLLGSIHVISLSQINWKGLGKSQKPQQIPILMLTWLEIRVWLKQAGTMYTHTEVHLESACVAFRSNGLLR